MSYMNNLKQLSQAQIAKIIGDSQAELNRRKNIDSAAAEIQRILKKYKIGIDDIDTKKFTKTSIAGRPKKQSNATKSNDQRRTVNAKYKDPNGAAKWTGRGKPPAWVIGICQNEGIDIEAFKKDDRFKC